MGRRDPSLLPIAVLLGVLAVLLLAVGPGGRLLEMVVSEAETAKFATAIIAAVATLLGALIGGTIAGGMNYVIGRQTRLGALEQDRQKARRERHTARVAPFLAVVDRRLHDYALVVAAVRQALPDEYREAVLQASKDDLVASSAIMPLARRHDEFGVVLANFLTAEGAARDALGAIVFAESEWPQVTRDGPR